MDDDRPHLLFLCHRIPYPPDKGDKIRSHRWWLELVEHFQVHLGAFIDDQSDWSHVRMLQERCASSLFLPLRRKLATLKSLRGFLEGKALTCPYYRDARLRRWVQRLHMTTPIDHVLVFSSAMAQYVDDQRWSGARRVIDFVDVDSDKWRQYAESKSWPAAWIYRREAALLAAAEVRLAQVFDASVLVSEPEAELLRGRVAGAANRVVAISNGVDASYFAAAPQRSSPYDASYEPIVFTGAMDYWANVDAVLWFVREVWPRVKQQRPRVLLAIVGARPTREIEALRSADILVTGWVPDVRPYLQHAAAVVAPMRIARGIQNKVLEGMAMGKAVVVTSRGLEGIAALPGRELLVADDPVDYADEILAVLAGQWSALGGNARQFVKAHCGWASSARALISLVLGRR